MRFEVGLNGRNTNIYSSSIIYYTVQQKYRKYFPELFSVLSIFHIFQLYLCISDKIDYALLYVRLFFLFLKNNWMAFCLSCHHVIEHILITPDIIHFTAAAFNAEYAYVCVWLCCAVHGRVISQLTEHVINKLNKWL